MIDVPTKMNTEAEKIVAGCVLLGPDELDQARALVRPEEFSSYPC